MLVKSTLIERLLPVISERKRVQVSGNVDLTPTFLHIAGGAGYVPDFMDGKL